MSKADFRELQQQLDSLDKETIRESFQSANEFMQIDQFLPSRITADLVAELDKLDAAVHRNFIPKHKKGGSVSRFDLDRLAQAFGQLYNYQPLNDFLGFVADRPLLKCPGNDPHTYALYYYTEPGDHIGYHYDTSYYKGARYTVLLGLVDESSCRLEYQLHKDDETRETEILDTQLSPGKLVFFNGDKLYHRITPLQDNERRIALTLEYLTSEKMNPVLRFISNMKDSIAYFGFKQVFGQSRR